MLLHGQQLGKYEILKTLGSGGFGTVYLVKDTWIDKKFAMKVPHRQGADWNELLKEPRLLAALDHKNIVRIVTADRSGDYFFIVMEFIEGETLETVLACEGGPLAPPQALGYATQICEGVAHAHRQSVLHRDLRPGNVLITEAAEVKITDFGTSRFLEIAEHASTVIGSPPYMAPEQFEGRAVFASDIYSVGVLIYEMLTGSLPYFSVNPREIEKMARAGRIVPPRERNRAIPRELNEIILKALAVDPAQRYQRADELLADLTTASEIDHRASAIEDIRRRVKAREPAAGGYCWNCRKPLHARAASCPFCGEKR